MQSFEQIYTLFESRFSSYHLASKPETLYHPINYFLSISGKKIRPVACLMSNNLFGEIKSDAIHAAIALELFHNFTLVHDDIMDNASLRRGKTTLHEKYNSSTAILSGDVLCIEAYKQLQLISNPYLHPILHIFNTTAIEICEGQQLDLDFEKLNSVSIPSYIEMITLKTAVLLGAALKIGALLGGATEGCAQLLYQVGKNTGIAFQLMDDYLDTYGNSEITGKEIGGDIRANKKTFLACKAFELANENEQKQLLTLQQTLNKTKITDTVQLFNQLNVNEYLLTEIKNYTEKAFTLLEEVPVLSSQKKELKLLIQQLLIRKS